MAFGLLAACGKVGDPLPPVTQAPASVSTMDAVQQGDDSVLILFPLPASAVQEVSVFRRCGPADENPQQQILEVGVAELHPLPDGRRYALRDPSPRLDVSCAYQVQFRNRYGRRSEMSNEVSTVPGPAPPSPVDLRVDVRESEIDVSWNPPKDAQGIVGYLVNFLDFVTEPHYVLHDFELGKPLTIVVQSVGRVQDPMILSPPTATLTLTPQDTFAPAVPLSLTAVAVSGGVQLVWDAVTAPDLSGYNVYRRAEGEREFEKIAGPVKVPRYFDAVERAGGVLYYEVTAVDRWGNESPRSEEAAASLQH